MSGRTRRSAAKSAPSPPEVTMGHREAFLKMLRDNEDDVATRLVYADWLDEQGEVEEADRQRKWQAAKAWIIDLIDAVDSDEREQAKRHGYDPEPSLTYAELIRQAEEELRSSTMSIACGRAESLCDMLRR